MDFLPMAGGEVGDLQGPFQPILWSKKQRESRILGGFVPSGYFGLVFF